jgi:TolA-binding protein
MARLGTRLDELGREAGQLQGRVDELRRRIDTLALQFETVGAPAGSGSAQPAPATVAQRPTTPGAQASDLYQTAYIDFTRGHYNLAIAAFREYVRLYPGTPLTEKAQYWIGESHFSLARAHQARGEADRAVQELERAVQEFRRVVIAYPRGDRVPAAIYKEALALSELGQLQLAEARLQFLVDQFPSTEEAAQAKDELARLRKR